MQKVIAVLSVLMLCLSCTSFIDAQDKVHWLTVDELQLAYQRAPRPIIVDVYTSWCGWCKTMDADTYSNDSVAAYINQHYYALKFDAEAKEPVQWRGKTYIYNEHYKVNEFSLFITNGQMSYPTTVLLAGIDLYPSPLSGYLKPAQIEGPLQFIGDGIYKKENYPDFIKTFSATW